MRYAFVNGPKGGFVDHFHPSIYHCISMCIECSEKILQFYGKAKRSFPLNNAIYGEKIEFDNIGKMFKKIVDAIHFVHEADWLHNDIRKTMF